MNSRHLRLALRAAASLLLLMVCVLISNGVHAGDGDSEYRTWTDSTGRFQLEARFEKFENGKVHLVRKQGDAITLTAGQLSKADQLHLRQLLAKPASAPLAKPASADSHSNWLHWRGPTHNGIAEPNQTPPTNWSETENVVWKVPLPGRGHSSPMVIGNQVVVTTADERSQAQAVVSFDTATGKQLWSTELNRGGFPRQIHAKNTHASPSVVSNGTKLFATFSHHNAIHVTALDLAGKQLWQTVAGPFDPKKYEYGYAPSPVLHGSLLIVAADYEHGWLTALDSATGKPVWQIERPKGISFSSPVVAEVAGREQLLLTGLDQLISYHPATGKQLWATNVLTSATCGTVVWDSQTVYASGGYPKAETAAIAADGSGRVLWRNREKCYEQSMLFHEGHLYAVNDKMIAFCWRGSDGKEQWSTRLGRGGAVSASLTLAGGNLYCSNEAGTTFVFKASPESYQQVGENQTGDEIFASPTIVANRIYLRAADSSNGPRQESIYCLGAN